MIGVESKLVKGLAVEEVEKIIRSLSKYPEIDSALLFGSRALGTHHPASDIDICLKGNGLGLDTLLGLEADLDDLLLPFKFDVVIYNQIDNPALISHIDRVGVPIFERKKEST